MFGPDFFLCCIFVSYAGISESHLLVLNIGIAKRDAHHAYNNFLNKILKYLESLARHMMQHLHQHYLVVSHAIRNQSDQQFMRENLVDKI